MALQPFRVNMDQDTLFFLIDFFNTLVPQEDEAASSGGTAGDLGSGGGGAVGQAQNADSQNCIRYSSGMQAIEIRCPPPPGPEGGAAEVFEDAVSSLPVIKEEGAAATPRSKSSTPGPAPAAGGGGAANIVRVLAVHPDQQVCRPDVGRPHWHPGRTGAAQLL